MVVHLFGLFRLGQFSPPQFWVYDARYTGLQETGVEARLLILGMRTVGNGMNFTPSVAQAPESEPQILLGLIKVSQVAESCARCNQQPVQSSASQT